MIIKQEKDQIKIELSDYERNYPISVQKKLLLTALKNVLLFRKNEDVIIKNPQNKYDKPNFDLDLGNNPLLKYVNINGNFFLDFIEKQLDELKKIINDYFTDYKKTHDNIENIKTALTDQIEMLNFIKYLKDFLKHKTPQENKDIIEQFNIFKITISNYPDLVNKLLSKFNKLKDLLKPIIKSI